MKSSEQSTFHMSPFTSNFVTFLSKEGIGHYALLIVGKVVLTPDFGMCQGRGLQRRKDSTLYDRKIWRVIMCHGQKILLTEGEEVDQIFWLRFGKSYLSFRSHFLFLRIDHVLP